MKSMKRIFSTLLAVTLLLSAVSGLFVIEIGAAPSATVQSPAIELYPTTSYKNPEEKLATMLLMSWNDEYRLYVDNKSGEVALEEIDSGNILFSNPYDVANDKVSQTETKKQLLSQLIITYRDTTGAEKSLYSYTDAALNGQISAQKIKNGVRIEYTIGREDTRKMVPKLILADSFEANILAPLQEVVDSGEILQEDLDVFLNSWQKIDINTMRKLLQLEYINRYPFLDTFKTVEVVDGKEVVTYPILYSFQEKIVNETQLLQREDYIKSYTDYSFEQMDADHEVTGYVAEDVRYPLFKLALEYYLSDEGMTVKLPCNGLRYDMATYTLEDITILPYIGVGNNANAGFVYNNGEELVKTEGYTFFPDGSGAIFGYEELNTTTTVKIPGKMYGEDFAYHQLFGIKNQKVIRYPVYGSVSSEVIHEYTYLDKNGTEETVRVSNTVKSTQQVKADIEALKEAGATILVENVGESAEVYHRGYLAIINSADSLAELQLVHGGALYGYNTILNFFNPKPKDSYNLSDAISVAGNTMMTVVSDRKYTGSIEISYMMLCDENRAAEAKSSNPNFEFFDTTWLGMAKAYRKHLADADVLDRLTANDVKADNIPLYIEVFGALETQQSIATIPVNMMTPLTTFDDLLAMYNELSAKGNDIKNINFKMTGFANGGMYYTVPSALDWEDAVGGKDGFKNLIKEAATINADQTKHLGLYPDFDFAYIHEDPLFDAVSLQDDAVKTIDNRYTAYRQYSATQQTFVSFYQLALSPARYEKFYTKLLSNYEQYGLKSLSVASLGTSLNSDFDEDEPFNREDSKEYTMSALSDMKNAGYSLMTDGGNAYTWAYVDHILGVELDSSRYLQARASVPFIGAVLHGSVQFAGVPLNEEGDARYALLRAIENGAAMYFILSTQNTSELKKDPYLSQYYSIDYNIWKEDVVEYYTELNNLMKDVQTDLIIDHRFLVGERVLELDELKADIEQKLEEAEKLEDAALKEQQTAELIAIADAWALAYNADATMVSLLADLAAISEAVIAYGDPAELMDMSAEMNAVLDAMKTLADYDAANADDTASDEYVEGRRQYEQALNRAQEALTDKIGALREYTEAMVNFAVAAEALYNNADRFTADLAAAVELINNTSIYDNDEATREALLDQVMQGKNIVDKYLPEIETALSEDVQADLENAGADAVAALQNAFYGEFEEGGAYASYADLQEALLDEFEALIFNERDIENMINRDEEDDSETVVEDSDEKSHYIVDNNKIALVVYGDEVNGEEIFSKAFILNYNTFDVRVEYGGTTYTIQSGGYAVVKALAED